MEYLDYYFCFHFCYFNNFFSYFIDICFQGASKSFQKKGLRSSDQRKVAPAAILLLLLLLSSRPGVSTFYFLLHFVS
jgi:hypothetical protein